MDADHILSCEADMTVDLPSMLDAMSSHRNSKEWPSEVTSSERWTSATPAFDDLLFVNPEDSLSFLPCLGNPQHMAPCDGQEMEEARSGDDTFLLQQDEWQMAADARLLPAPPTGGDYAGPVDNQLLGESGFPISSQAYSSGALRDPASLLEQIPAHVNTDAAAEGEGRYQQGIFCADIVHLTQTPSLCSGDLSGSAARSQAETKLNKNSALLFRGDSTESCTAGNPRRQDAKMGGEEPSSQPRLLSYAGSCTGHAPPMHNAQEHALMGEKNPCQPDIYRDCSDDGEQQSSKSDGVMQRSFWDMLQEDNDALMDALLVTATELPVMDHFPVKAAVSISPEAAPGLSDVGEGQFLHHRSICPEGNSVFYTRIADEPPASSPLLPQDSPNASCGEEAPSLQSRSPGIPINSRSFLSAFPGSCEQQGMGQSPQRSLFHTQPAAGRVSECTEDREGQASGQAGTSMLNTTEQVRKPPDLSARLAQVIDNIGSKQPSAPKTQGGIKRGGKNGVVVRAGVQSFEGHTVTGARRRPARRTGTEKKRTGRADKKGRKENISETEMHALDLAMLPESVSGSSNNLCLTHSGSSKRNSGGDLGYELSVRRDALSGQVGANAYDAHSSSQSLKQVHAQVPLLPWLSSGNQNIPMYGTHSSTFMPPRTVPRQVVGMAEYVGLAAASRADALPVLPKNYGWSFRSGLAIDGTFAPARIPRCLAPSVDSLRSCHVAEHDLPMRDVREMVLALAEAVATGEMVSRQGEGKECERKGGRGGRVRER